MLKIMFKINDKDMYFITSIQYRYINNKYSTIITYGQYSDKLIDTIFDGFLKLDDAIIKIKEIIED